MFCCINIMTHCYAHRHLHLQQQQQQPQQQQKLVERSGLRTQEAEVILPWVTHQISWIQNTSFWSFTWDWRRKLGARLGINLMTSLKSAHSGEWIVLTLGNVFWKTSTNMLSYFSAILKLWQAPCMEVVIPLIPTFLVLPQRSGNPLYQDQSWD